MQHTITNDWLDTDTAYRIAVSPNSKIILSDEVENCIRSCRSYLDQKLSSSNERFYGINTGFGALYNVGISSSDLRSLQQNLLMSHACGTGGRSAD
jgi:histidine ammonia-lyase